MKARIYRESDIRKAYENGKKDGIRKSIDSILSVVALKLQDKHGMNKEELHQLEKEVNEDFESVLSDRITLDEILETKEVEIGGLNDG